MNNWQRRGGKRIGVAPVRRNAETHSTVQLIVSGKANPDGSSLDSTDSQAPARASLPSLAVDPRLLSSSQSYVAVRGERFSETPKVASIAASVASKGRPERDDISAHSGRRDGTGPSINEVSDDATPVSSSAKKAVGSAPARLDDRQSDLTTSPARVLTGPTVTSNGQAALHAGVATAIASSPTSASPAHAGLGPSSPTTAGAGATSGSGMIMALHEGNTPSDLTAAEAWLGGKPGALTVFTGYASWSDFTGSVNYELDTWGSSNVPLLWSIPLIASGATLSQAATGAYDSYYVQAAKELAAGEPTGAINVRVGWEFNATWYPWSAVKDPTDYIAAYQQFVDSFRSVSNRFVFTWCPNIGPGGMNPADAYPGDNYVDVIGQDFYWDSKSWNSDPNHVFQTMVSETDGLQWLENFASAHDKPTAYPEWGIDGNQAGPFIADAAAWFSSHDVSYESYWDSDDSFAGKLSNGDYPDAGSAFLQAFGDSSTSVTVSSGQTYALTDWVVSGGATFLAGQTSQTEVISGTTILSGAYLEPVDAIVLSGGVETVALGGMAVSTTVSSGGVEQLLSGGATSGGTIAEGGLLSGTGTLSGEVDIYGAASGALVAASGNLVVLSGGASYAATVASGGSETVSAGGAAIFTTVEDGGDLIASADSVLSDITVLSGGELYGAGTISGLLTIWSGALVEGATLVSGATETLYGEAENGVDICSGAALDLVGGEVSSGGALTVGPIGTPEGVSGATLSSGATLTTLSATVLSGGSLIVTSGGAASATVVSNGGGLRLSAGAVASAATVSAGGALWGAGTALGVVADAGLVSGVTMGAGATLEVYSGGVASATRIGSGGQLAVQGSGSSVATYIAGGGVMTDLGGAVAATVVSSGGVLDAVGGTVSGAQVLSAGLLSGSGTAEGEIVVSSGGTLSGLSFASGSIDVLVNGGQEGGVTLSNGATLQFAGAVCAGEIVTLGSPTTAAGPSGITLLQGAREIASGVEVLSGGVEVVGSGAKSYAALVDDGGLLSGMGGYVSGLVVEAGGTVSRTATLLGASMDWGVIADVALEGSLEVGSGGSVSGDAVRSLAVEVIDAGGLASGTTISSGGLQRLYGSASAMRVLSGGVQSVGSGGTENVVKVYAGGFVTVEAGGTASATLVLGQLNVSSGGSAASTVIYSGGQVVVDAGGAATATALRAGAELVYGSSILDRVSAPGDEVVEAGGTASAGRVLGQLIVSSGGSAVSTLAYSGGEVVVDAGGAAAATALRAGVEMVYGSSISDRISAGGREVVEAGGSVLSAAIFASGSLQVESGGFASGIAVSSGGGATVSAGGSAFDVKIVSGGVLTDDGDAFISTNEVFAGGLTGSGVLVLQAGHLILSGGEAGFSGQVIVSGGKLELATSQGAGSAAITFATSSAAAVVQLDAADRPVVGGMFAEALVDFNQTLDRVDLAGLAYVSGASATLSGSRLTLTDGAASYGFTIQGTLASSYRAISDGDGGTLIVAEAGRTANALIQAIGSFDAQNDGPGGTPVHVPASSTREILSPPPAYAVRHG